METWCRLFGLLYRIPLLGGLFLFEYRAAAQSVADRCPGGDRYLVEHNLWSAGFGPADDAAAELPPRTYRLLAGRDPFDPVRRVDVCVAAGVTVVAGWSVVFPAETGPRTQGVDPDGRAA